MSALVGLTDILICDPSLSETLTGEADLQAAGPATLPDGSQIIMINQDEKGNRTFKKIDYFTPQRSCPHHRDGRCLSRCLPNNSDQRRDL